MTSINVVKIFLQHSVVIISLIFLFLGHNDEFVVPFSRSDIDAIVSLWALTVDVSFVSFRKKKIYQIKPPYIAVREAGVSRHHEGEIEGPLTSPQCMVLRGLRGAPNRATIMPRGVSLPERRCNFCIPAVQYLTPKSWNAGKRLSVSREIQPNLIAVTMVRLIWGQI